MTEPTYTADECRDIALAAIEAARGAVLREAETFAVANSIALSRKDAREATAAAEQRLMGLEEAARGLLDAESQPAYSWVIESQRARDEGTPNREVQRMDRIAAARLALRAALLDTPPSASPRQGEPVGLDAAWREVEAVLPQGTRLYLSQNSKGKWGAQIRGAQRTGRGGNSPAEALQALAVALSEPAEAGEP